MVGVLPVRVSTCWLITPSRSRVTRARALSKGDLTITLAVCPGL
ncbi:MAG: hypothetical protein BWY77_01077 [bacterium ADurb.Bin431]|nr:MAG: hypothetical protein BWY77_01077 [bacterium ADurb.Bin431]